MPVRSTLAFRQLTLTNFRHKVYFKIFRSNVDVAELPIESVTTFEKIEVPSVVGVTVINPVVGSSWQTRRQ